MRLIPVYDTPAEKRLVRRANELRDELVRLEKARDRHIAKMADGGLSIRAIAAEIGLGHGTVQRVVARARQEGQT